MTSKMSRYIKYQMLMWNVKCCEMLNVMKYQMLQNIKCHKISNVMKCKMSGNEICHKMPNLWNVNCHET